MLRKGTSVKIIYPQYAAGVTGKLISLEESSQRWIVRLDTNPIKDKDKQETIYLSLEESDFQIID
jgi:hypothetical protein